METEEEAKKRQEKLRARRWAHRNFGMSIGAAVMLLIWYGAAVVYFAPMALIAAFDFFLEASTDNDGISGFGEN